MQSVGGTHFELDHIELAPGETPYALIPTEIPAPPQVRSLSEVVARRRMYAHAVGRLTSVTPEPNNSFWSVGVLTLADGTELALQSMASSKGYAEFVGQEVTVLGLLADQEPPSLGVRRMCAGVVARCQMTDDNFRK